MQIGKLHFHLHLQYTSFLVKYDGKQICFQQIALVFTLVAKKPPFLFPKSRAFPGKNHLVLSYLVLILSGVQTQCTQTMLLFWCADRSKRSVYGTFSRHLLPKIFFVFTCEHSSLFMVFCTSCMTMPLLIFKTFVFFSGSINRPTLREK